MAHPQARAVSFATVGDKLEFGSHPAMASAQAPATVAAMAGVVAPVREAHPAPAGGNLSCNTCKESFRALEDLRKHFDSELHLHNIRARVEGQPILDRNEFRRMHGGADPDNSGSVGPTPIFTCNLCKRTYKSAQTLQSHLKSTEHLMRKEQRILERQSNAGSVLSSTSLGSAAMGLHRRHKAHTKNLARNSNGNGGADEVENVIDDDGNVVTRAVATAKPKVPVEDREADVTPARCFFCGHKSTSIAANLKHMLDLHQFSLPLEDRVTDLVGLMDYLAKKINACLCLVCAENTKRYETLEALRGHMRTSGHERIELSPEYADFYEGTKLDDGSEAKLKRVEDERTGQLVVKTGSGASIMPREGEMVGGGVVRYQRESVTQKEDRKMLTASKIEEQALMVKERYELMAPARKEESKLQAQQHKIKSRIENRVSIRAWKFHPKGFEGDDTW